MQFYLIPEANGLAPELAATQADARTLCKSRGLKFDPETMAHDVPTDKARLLAYVNGLLSKAISPAYPLPVTLHCGDPAKPGEAQEIATVDFPAAKGPAELPAYAHQEKDMAGLTSFTSDAIQAFILDRATVGQVENIFACLGTRFAEMVKA